MLSSLSKVINEGFGLAISSEPCFLLKADSAALAVPYCGRITWKRRSRNLNGLSSKAAMAHWPLSLNINPFHILAILVCILIKDHLTMPSVTAFDWNSDFENLSRHSIQRKAEF